MYLLGAMGEITMLRRGPKVLPRWALVAAALIISVPSPLRAEFQIQEAGIEKGEVEIEYRGAYHWGVPEATNQNQNANDVVQSHEIELQMGISDWWLIEV